MAEITKANIEAAIEQIKAGSTLADTSKTLDLPYNLLQVALKKSLGKEPYATLMQSVQRSFGGVAVVIDDSRVPVITKTKVAEGWLTETMTIRHHREQVFTAPDGKRYVRAQGHEKADLIVDLTRKQLGKVRLRLEQHSSLARRAHREEKLIAQGEEQRNRRFQEATGDPTAIPNGGIAKTKRVRRKK